MYSSLNFPPFSCVSLTINSKIHKRQISASLGSIEEERNERDSARLGEEEGCPGAERAVGLVARKSGVPKLIWAQEEALAFSGHRTVCGGVGLMLKHDTEAATCLNKISLKRGACSTQIMNLGENLRLAS